MITHISCLHWDSKWLNRIDKNHGSIAGWGYTFAIILGPALSAFSDSISFFHHRSVSNRFNAHYVPDLIRFIVSLTTAPWLKSLLLLGFVSQNTKIILSRIACSDFLFCSSFLFVVSECLYQVGVFFSPWERGSDKSKKPFKRIIASDVFSVTPSSGRHCRPPDSQTKGS